MGEILSVLAQNQDSILVLLFIIFLFASGAFFARAVWPFSTSLIDRFMTSWIDLKNKEIDHQNKFTGNLLETMRLINTNLQALNSSFTALDTKIDTLMDGKGAKNERFRVE